MIFNVCQPAHAVPVQCSLMMIYKHDSSLSLSLPSPVVTITQVCSVTGEHITSHPSSSPPSLSSLFCFTSVQADKTTGAKTSPSFYQFVRGRVESRVGHLSLATPRPQPRGGETGRRWVNNGDTWSLYCWPVYWSVLAASLTLLFPWRESSEVATTDYQPPHCSISTGLVGGLDWCGATLTVGYTELPSSLVTTGRSYILPPPSPHHKYYTPHYCQAA